MVGSDGEVAFSIYTNSNGEVSLSIAGLASHQKCICLEECTGKLLRYAMTCYVVEIRDDVGWCKARG
jgi:hypothetical protein